jgi:phage tail sheath protein FI
MPVQVSYPGVYIQEVPSGVHTITGVSTSIAAFFGRTAKGPINKAIRCLSLADFNRAFGGPHPSSDLGQSVRHFFDNGGTDCYVVRLAAGAQAASLTLTSNTNAIAGGTRNVLVVKAKTPGIWGEGLRLEIDYNTLNPDESFIMTVIQLDAGNEVARERHTALSMDPSSPRFAPAYVTQSSSLIDLSLHGDVAPPVPGPAGPFDITVPANSFPGFSQSAPTGVVGISPFRTMFEGLLTNSPNFELIVDEQPPVKISLATVLGPAAPAILPGTTWALSPDMENRLNQVINGQLPPGLAVLCTFQTSGNSRSLRITANDGGRQRSVRVRRVTEKDFAVPMMLGIDQGGIEVTRYSNFRPVPTGGFFTDATRIVDLGALTRDQVTQVQLDTDPAITFPTNGFSPTGTDLWTVGSAAGVNGVREKLQAIVKAINDSPTSNWKAELWGYHIAFYAKDKSAGINLTPASVASTANNLSGAAPGANFTRNARQYAVGIAGTSAFQKPVNIPLDRGIDGNAPLLPEFKGNQDAQTGFFALDAVDLFNLMVIPADDEISQAVHQTIWGPASVYCQQHRAFLLIDAPPNWTANERPIVKDNPILITNLRQAGVVKDYSAVFYPRMFYINDAGLRKPIGPSGAIAGLMARTDSQRGVWKAPAGIEADIRGIVGLEVKLTDLENGVLNKQAVNCLRAFPTGLVNWGARTMDGFDDNSTEWKYIPIRRLALFLEESLFRGTKWVVFEPNDEPLWASIRLNLNAFMMSLFRQGAFQGSTPDKAFYVKCDGETTTQNDRNLGIVNIEVGFAPLKPAEFVIIKIQQIAGDLT